MQRKATPMDAEQRAHLEDLLNTYRRRLRPLEKQAATFGVRTDAHVLIEIEDIRIVIQQLEEELASGQTSVYIITELPRIKRFEPSAEFHTRYRYLPSGGEDENTVFAIDRDQLYKYLFPLNCPRVTFFAGPESAPADVERLMGASTAKYVVAIESRWLPQIQSQCLYLYELPGDTFTTKVRRGHYSSRASVVPRTVTKIEDLLNELLAFDVELRVMPSLWTLYEAVKASTLQYSNIRMQYALPPDEE
jgi:hypothetical protein